jgi:hypothetical protein
MEKTRKIESYPQTQSQPRLISRGIVVSMHKIVFSFNGIFNESYILWFANVLNFKDRLRKSSGWPDYRYHNT